MTINITHTHAYAVLQRSNNVPSAHWVPGGARLCFCVLTDYVLSSGSINRNAREGYSTGLDVDAMIRSSGAG